MIGHSFCTIDWEKVVRVFSALLVPTIGVVTAYIAWQQHKTNSRQLRLALFSRRLEVFNGAMKLIAAVIRNANVQMNDLYDFLRDTREHVFLFGSDIEQYLSELYKEAAKVHSLVAAQQPANAQQQTVVMMWFSGQSEVARKKFAEYMSLGERD